MKKIIRTAGLLLLGGIAAYPASYTFDITGSDPQTNIAGDVLGTVTLGDGDGTFAASSVVIMSSPISPWGDAAAWPVVYVNSFTVAGGKVTTFQFLAVSATTPGNFTVIGMNNTLTPEGYSTDPFYAPLGVQIPSGLAGMEIFNPSTMKIVLDNTSVFNAGDLLNPGTAAPEPHFTGSPEPGTWLLTGVGLSLLAAGRRSLICSKQARETLAH